MRYRHPFNAKMYGTKILIVGLLRKGIVIRKLQEIYKDHVDKIHIKNF